MSVFLATLEWRRLWATAMPYLTAAVFAGLSGYFFCMLLFVSHHADVMPGVASSMVFFLLVLIPFLTMRLFVEDRSLGVDVLFQTSPVTVTQLVLGKYLAVFGTVCVFLVATLPIPVALLLLGDPDLGLLFGAYVSLFCFSAAVSAIGLWASAAARHQVVAALLGFGLLMFLWVSGALAGVLYGTVGHFFEHLSMPNHVTLMQQGMVTAGDVGYFLVMTVFFLVLTGITVVLRRGVT